MKRKMINKMVGDKYVVCVEGKRVRVMDGPAPAEPVQDRGFFVPGWLLTAEESKPLIKQLA